MARTAPGGRWTLHPVRQSYPDRDRAVLPAGGPRFPGFVIIIHELGHYAFAKWAGVRVDVFAVGFGKTILSRRWGETEYCLNILPFGGYVKRCSARRTSSGQQPAGEARSIRAASSPSRRDGGR